MKLYCDAMLIKLGRWLRVAGYDTRIAGLHLSDREVFESAKSEKRKLITRDRKLEEFSGADQFVVLLHANLLNDCVAELTKKLNINWMFRPFSRCVNCNSVLHEADVEQVTNLNRSLKLSVNNVYYCEQCKQLFWEGSHVRRMRARLEEFTKYSKD